MYKQFCIKMYTCTYLISRISLVPIDTVGIPMANVSMEHIPESLAWYSWSHGLKFGLVDLTAFVVLLWFTP